MEKITIFISILFLLLGMSSMEFMSSWYVILNFVTGWCLNFVLCCHSSWYFRVTAMAPFLVLILRFCRMSGFLFEHGVLSPCYFITHLIVSNLCALQFIGLHCGFNM